MDTERQNKILTIGELLNKTVLGSKLNKTDFSMIAKHSTIFSFWDNIVGKKIANISKPYKISASKIYITAKSPTVSQQIALTKNKIIEKLNTYSKPLGIEIKDIITNYKNYDELTLTDAIPESEQVVWLDNKILDKIELSEEMKLSIQKAINKIKFLDESQKEKLLNKILNNCKATIYRETVKTDDFLKNTGQKF